MNEELFKHTCHDCNAKEGELHKIGCDMERCPVCGKQALTCYEHCFNSDGIERKSFIEGKRIPYIIVSVFCGRCLKPYPDFFKVSKEEWKKVPLELRNKVLCKSCYNKIKGWLKKVEHK